MESSNLSRIENPKVGRVAPPTAQTSGSNESLRAAQSAHNDTKTRRKLRGRNADVLVGTPTATVLHLCSGGLLSKQICDVTTLRHGVTTLCHGVTTLRRGVTTLRHGVTTLRHGVTTLCRGETTLRQLHLQDCELSRALM